MNQVEKDRFKNMSPEKKLQLSLDLYYSAKELKRAWLNHIHPDWDTEKIEAKLREIFFFART